MRLEFSVFSVLLNFFLFSLSLISLAAANAMLIFSGDETGQTEARLKTRMFGRQTACLWRFLEDF